MKKAYLLLATMGCLAMLVSGCAAKLEVFEAGDQEKLQAEVTRVKKGIPFRVPTPYVIEGCLTKLKTGGNCDALPFLRVKSLPSEKLYYLSVNPGMFANSEFSMSLDDRGNLNQVSVNSEPALSETLDSVTDAIVELKKLTEAKEAVGGEGLTEDLKTSPPCNTGEIVYEITPLNEWETAEVKEQLCDKK